MSEQSTETRISLLEQNFSIMNDKLDAILDFIKNCNQKEINYIKELNSIKTEQEIIKTRINTVATIFTVIIVPLFIATIPILIDHHIPQPHQHENN